MTDKLKALIGDRERLKEALRYVVFGVLTTAVNWVLYWLLTEALGLKSHPEGTAAYHAVATAANIIAWVLAVLFAFFTNKRYVFRSDRAKKGAWREFALFVSARVLSLVLFDVLLFNLCLLFMNDKVAKLLMNVLVVIFNYFASKFVIFRKAGENKAGST